MSKAKKKPTKKKTAKKKTAKKKTAKKANKGKKASAKKAKKPAGKKASSKPAKKKSTKKSKPKKSEKGRELFEFQIAEDLRLGVVVSRAGVPIEKIDDFAASVSERDRRVQQAADWQARRRPEMFSRIKSFCGQIKSSELSGGWDIAVWLDYGNEIAVTITYGGSKKDMTAAAKVIMDAFQSAGLERFMFVDTEVRTATPAHGCLFRETPWRHSDNGNF